MGDSINTSIHIKKDLVDQIDERCGPDESRSEWIKRAIRRELDHEHDDIEEIENRLADLEEWKEDTMEDVIQWFNSEFGPPQ